MKLKGKRIVITGGTSGIGYELVKSFYSDNELIVVSRDQVKLSRLSDELQRIAIYKADLSKLEDIVAVADAIKRQYESIDLLINNAAIQYTATFLDETFRHENIADEIAVNFTGICCLTYHLLPSLLHDESTVILNVNSGLALAPKKTSAVYCATKGGLNTFTQSLRYQLEKTNISVQQAFLPLVDTQMTRGRGRNKMSAQEAAIHVIRGVERDIQDHYIGKVKLLKILLRLTPSVALRITKKY